MMKLFIPNCVAHIKFLNFSSFAIKDYASSSSSKSAEHFRQTHAQLIRNGGIEDILTAGKLVADIATSNPSNLNYAQSVVSHLGYRPNVFMWNSMIRGYAHSPTPEAAIFWYRKMLEEGLFPNTYTFPFVLKACAQLLDRNQSLGLGIHGTVIKCGLEDCDPFIQTSLVNYYACCGYVDIARKLFDQCLQKDVTSWNALIKAYVRSNRFMDAIRVFRMMLCRMDIKVDEITILGVVLACTQLGALDMGKWIHAYIDKNCMRISISLGTALIDMYAKCGSIEVAKVLFDEMPLRDVRTWSIMIGGLASHGLAKEALTLFEKMQKVGLHPDSVTFTSVFSACSHGGMVDEGLKILDEMREQYNVEPTIEHYGCIVDLLGRSKRLDEALSLIRKIPLKPDAILWGALLVACRAHKNVEMGEMVAKEMLKVDPHHCGAHVFLSNVYASSGRWEEVENIRASMKEKGIRKPPGLSLIELEGNVHEFIAGDSSHSQIDCIRMMLNEIQGLLSLEGHVPRTLDISLDIAEEEKEQALYQHSEKLAVAFGLLNTRKGDLLRIVKNLRVCDDCHSFMKLVSKVYNRVILIRDRSRFHHFSNGACSCGDYW